MSDAETPAGERIEWTHYGDPQHEIGTESVETRPGYGDPQHDPDPPEPGAVARLRYEDRHWRNCEKHGAVRPTADKTHPRTGTQRETSAFGVGDCGVPG